MAGAVNVSVVTLVGFVLDVSDGNGNTAFALFGGLVDVGKCLELSRCGAVGTVVFRQNLGNRGSQRSFTMVNVTDGADVYMRLSTLELFLCH